MAHASRYSRQETLAEVGADGQAALASATVAVGTGAGALIELSYLERAGVGHVRVDASAPQVDFAHREHFRCTAAREHAGGAWRALGQIRAILEKR